MSCRRPDGTRGFFERPREVAASFSHFFQAGLGAIDGQPPTPHSVTAAMKEIGIDISAQTQARAAHD